MDDGDRSFSILGAWPAADVELHFELSGLIGRPAEVGYTKPISANTLSSCLSISGDAGTIGGDARWCSARLGA